MTLPLCFPKWYTRRSFLAMGFEPRLPHSNSHGRSAEPRPRTRAQVVSSIDRALRSVVATGAIYVSGAWRRNT